MATYAAALPALTTGLFCFKCASLSLNASVFHDRDVRVRVTPRPDYCRPVSLTCEPDVPAWLMPTVQSFLYLLQLPRNWDGYGAMEIQEQIARKALMVLVEVPAGEVPGFYYYEDGSELESEGQVSRSYDRIQAYIANLK